MGTERKGIRRWAGHSGGLAAGVAAGLLVGAASGVAFASIPDQSGVIHACDRAGNNGSLRIIDTASQTCSSNETAISWNQAGPAGPAGPQGPTGPAGPGGGSVLIDDLSDAYLQEANFVGWNLAGRDFSGANLEEARFQVADLTGTDFSAASFSSTRFAGAALTNADFTGATFINGARGVDFRGANMPATVFVAMIDFTGSDFSGVNLAGATFGPDYDRPFGVVGGTFDQANLTGATFGTNFQGISFVAADLSDSVFLARTQPFGQPGMRLVDVNFTDADFTGVQFDSAAGPFIVQGSNFTGADLSGADLSGFTWDDTICPDGTNSNDNGNTCVGHVTP